MELNKDCMKKIKISKIQKKLNDLRQKHFQEKKDEIERLKKRLSELEVEIEPYLNYEIDSLYRQKI